MELISREAAIEAVGDVQPLDYNAQAIVERIKALPTAERVGKWIKLYAGNYKCSVCGDWWGNDNNEMVEDFRYCPNCGTRMRGEVDE